MLHPSTIFSKLKISESNLKLIIFSGFAMYFLVLYEMFPQYLFDVQYVLFTLVVPLVAIVVGLNIKKINLKNISLKNFSLKNISVKGKEDKKNQSKDETSNQIQDLDSEVEGNSEIDALLAGTNSDKDSGISEMEDLLAKTDAEGKKNGSSEIEAMLAKTEGGEKSDENSGGNSEIEALLAGVETEEGDNYSDSSLDNSDTELIIMEKLEPIENDVQTLKTDFDQFKQDLTTVKEEVEILSNSFESTLTDIKLLTTDMNNPLNFMKEDSSFKENIQTINVDELIQKPINPPDIPKPNSEIQKPVVEEPVVEEKSEIPKDVISLIDELSRDFIPEEVFELAKVHCKTLNIEIDEKQLRKFIDKKNNSDVITKDSEKKSEMEDLLAKTIENEVK